MMSQISVIELVGLINKAPVQTDFEDVGQAEVWCEHNYSYPDAPVVAVISDSDCNGIYWLSQWFYS